MIRNGREVSRIEGFSDAVFGFALTRVEIAVRSRRSPMFMVA